MNLLQLGLAATALGACTTPSVTDRQSLTVVTGGDDGLTQRLAATVRIEAAQSSRFDIAGGDRTASLTILIPTHVDWDEVGGRARARYRADFQRAGATISSASGSCWDNELSACAKQIVAAATQTPR